MFCSEEKLWCTLRSISMAVAPLFLVWEQDLVQMNNAMVCMVVTHHRQQRERYTSFSRIVCHSDCSSFDWHLNSSLCHSCCWTHSQGWVSTRLHSAHSAANFAERLGRIMQDKTSRSLGILCCLLYCVIFGINIILQSIISLSHSIQLSLSVCVSVCLCVCLYISAFCLHTSVRLRVRVCVSVHLCLFIYIPLIFLSSNKPSLVDCFRPGLLNGYWLIILTNLKSRNPTHKMRERESFTSSLDFARTLTIGSSIIC